MTHSKVKLTSIPLTTDSQQYEYQIEDNFKPNSIEEEPNVKKLLISKFLKMSFILYQQ
jgi:hypothetical protein